MLRRDNSSLDSTNHELEKTVSQLRMRVAVLEQELQDKGQVCGLCVWVVCVGCACGLCVWVVCVGYVCGLCV